MVAKAVASLKFLDGDVCVEECELQSSFRVLQSRVNDVYSFSILIFNFILVLFCFLFLFDYF